jgi:signal transduction histidine kinase
MREVIVNVRPYSEGVEICVTDTGVELEPSALPLTLAAVPQTESDVFRHQSSLDLKLSLVRRLLDLLGGTFLVESMNGHGSMFRVRIPTIAEAESVAERGH